MTHMLDLSLAQKLIEQITKYTEYNVNIMNKDGVIIASKDAERIGTYHEPAWQIVHGEEDMITVSSDGDYPGASRGINMVIDIDGRREGVVGVTGDPETIRPVALVIKMSIETMIKYEEQKMKDLRRQTKKERLLELILSGRGGDSRQTAADAALSEMRSLMQELGFRADVPRTAILCRTEDSHTQAVRAALKDSPAHSKEDVFFLPDKDHILICKSSLDTSPGGYRREIAEYLGAAGEKISRDGRKCRFYVGTLQDHLSCYHVSWQHCRWLEEHMTSVPGNDTDADSDTSCPADAVWFYDHAGEYLTERIPARELHHIFDAYVKNIPADSLKHYAELAGSLIASDFSISVAARKLYMHKNTFTYQYNRLLGLLNLDPRSAPEDKSFMIFLYLYLTRCRDRKTET